MKRMFLFTMILILSGCGTHYITTVHTPQGVPQRQYKMLAVRDIKKTIGVEDGAGAIVETSTRAKLGSAGFTVTPDRSQAEALVDVHILQYKSLQRWSSGTPGSCSGGYTDKKGRYHPGHCFEGSSPGYYDSGDVRIQLQMVDGPTGQVVWESTAYGSGVPAGIVDNVLQDLVDCMKRSVAGGDCSSLMNDRFSWF